MQITKLVVNHIDMRSTKPSYPDLHFQCGKDTTLLELQALQQPVDDLYPLASQQLSSKNPETACSLVIRIHVFKIHREKLTEKCKSSRDSSWPFTLQKSYYIYVSAGCDALIGYGEIRNALNVPVLLLLYVVLTYSICRTPTVSYTFQWN